MTNIITLETIQARQDELVAMIAAFSAAIDAAKGGSNA